VSLAPLEASSTEATSLSGRGARPRSTSSAAQDFDGRLHLGGASLGFETSTAVKTAPLRDDKDIGLDDINPRPNTGLKIPFIGLSISRPIQ